MSFFELNERCTGCLACVENCPTGALAFRDESGTRIILHNISRCARCATCFRVCPEQAIEFGRLLEGRWEEIKRLELVRCRVCAEVLHTVPLGKKIPAKVLPPEPLCPKHRTREQAGVRRSLPHRRPA